LLCTAPSRTCLYYLHRNLPPLHSFPTRRSSDLRDLGPLPQRRSGHPQRARVHGRNERLGLRAPHRRQRADPDGGGTRGAAPPLRSEEHTSELQSRENLVCRLLLEKTKNNIHNTK